MRTVPLFPTVYRIVPGSRAKPGFLAKLVRSLTAGAAALAIVWTANPTAARTVLSTPTAPAGIAEHASPKTPIVLATHRDAIEAVATLAVRAAQPPEGLAERERSLAEWATGQRLIASLRAADRGAPVAAFVPMDWDLTRALAKLPETSLRLYREALATQRLSPEATQVVRRLFAEREKAAAERSRSENTRPQAVCIVFGTDIPAWWRNHYATAGAFAPPSMRPVVQALADRTVGLFSDDDITRIVWAHEYGHCLDEELAERHAGSLPRNAAFDLDLIRRAEQRADIFAYLRASHGMAAEDRIRLGRHMALWRASDTVAAALRGERFDAIVHHTEVALHLFLEDARTGGAARRAEAAAAPRDIMREVSLWLADNRDRIVDFTARYRAAYERIAAAAAERGLQGVLALAERDRPRDAAEALAFAVLRPAIATLAPEPPQTLPSRP